MPSDRNLLVSIVTTTLDAVNAVETLLRNVHQETYRPLELIVVDGGSSDGTVEKVQLLMTELSDESFSIRLIQEKNFGPQRSTGNAKNIAVRASRGQKVVFLDPDMFFIGEHAVDLISQKLEEVAFTRVNARLVLDTQLERLRARGYPRYHHCGYRRSVFESVQFDPSLGFGEDQDFWFRLKRDLGLNLDEICNALIGRHLPHTKAEYLRQSVWYARTMPQFARVVVARGENEMIAVLCDWWRYWFYCLFPIMTLILPFSDYVRREEKSSTVGLSFLIWDSVVRRYVSFYHFLRATIRARSVLFSVRLLISCLRTYFVPLSDFRWLRPSAVAPK